jgi:hypothetical protein
MVQRIALLRGGQNADGAGNCTTTADRFGSLLVTNVGCCDQEDDDSCFPLTGTAVNPDLVGISLATTITLVAGSTQTDKDTAAGQAAAAAQDYLNNLRVGDPLIINDIAAAIRNASSKILDVGEPNRQIEEIYLLDKCQEFSGGGGFAPLATMSSRARQRQNAPKLFN